MQLNIDKHNWELVKLGEVFLKKEENDKVNAGKRFDRFLKVEHLDKESLHVRRWASQENGDELNPTFYKIFRKGQILFPTRNPHLRRTALASFDGICGEKTLTLEPIEEFLFPEFIPFLFHSEGFYNHTTSAIIGSTNPHVRWRNVANYEFLLPPKDQQAQLAELLWAMDEVVEGYYQIKLSIEALKKRVSYDCYYAPNVQKVPLEELTIKIQDGSHFSPKVIYSENDGQKFRYVTSKNIRITGIEFKENQFVDKEFHDSIYPRCNVQKGDVLLTKDGANTGTATLNSLEEEFSLLSSVCLIRANNRTSNSYLCHYINSDIGNYNLVNQMTGTAITRLTLTTLKKIRIPIPDDQIQDEVVGKLDSFDLGIQAAIEGMKSSQVLQKSLINQIF